MQTAATKQFAADLKSAGVEGEPTYAMYAGYTSIGLLVEALKGSGGNTSSSAIIASLSKIHRFSAMGLFGSHTVDINDRDHIVYGADNCVWTTKLEGKSFTLVKGATPICGTVITGKTVAPAS